MVFKRRIILIMFLLSILLIIPSISFSAIFSVDILGLPEPISEIQSFSIWLSVDDDFAFSDFAIGDALPQLQPGQMLGWDLQSEVVPDADRGLVFKIGGLDQDGAFLSNYYELTDGNICTFDYSGGILGVTDILQISNRSGVNQYDPLIFSHELTETTLTISSVPIPSSILLLGGGLIGCIAYRRKRS